MSSPDCLPFSLETLDCRNSTGWCLRAYGDVSGYGAIVGFKGTGYYIIFLLITYYVAAFDPRRNSFEPDFEGPEQSLTTSWEPNPIDIMVLDFIRKKCLPRRMRKYCTSLGDCLVASILQICDIQAFTGIAILISGFISFSTGISAYHWQIIAFLAWFSSITHLSGLTVLRNHPCRQHQRNTKLRMVLMAVLLALLLVATIPTGYFSWGDSKFHSLPSDEKQRFMSSPAICYLSPNSGTWYIWGSVSTENLVTETASFQSMVFSALFLFLGFLTRAVKMSRRLSQNITTKIRRPISHHSQRILVKVSSRNGKRNRHLRNCIWHLVIVQPCLAVFISARIIADSYSSLFTEVICILLAVVWGGFKIIGATGQLPRDIFEQENQWTFGQIVPVLLLAVPIFGTIIHLASNLTVSDPSDGHDHEIPNAVASLARKPYPFTTESSELPEVLIDAYSSRTLWLWPSLVGFFLSIAYFAFEVFSNNFGITRGMRPYGSLVEVWFTHLGLLWYISFGLPFVLFNTIAIGLALDAWLDRPKKFATRVRTFLYLFLVTVMAFGSVSLWLWLVFLNYQSYLFEGLHMSDNTTDWILLHIIRCLLMNFLCYIFYLFVAFAVHFLGSERNTG